MTVTGVAGQLFDRLQAGRKIAFLGVGSPLRADDSVGLHIVSGLEDRLKSNLRQEYRFFLGESVPENFSGVIAAYAPAHLVIFDAADLGERPGTFSVIEPEQIGGISFVTHMLPLKILADYLVKASGCQITVIGVQPRTLEFAYPLSSEIKTVADRFIAEFCKLCSQNR